MRCWAAIRLTAKPWIWLPPLLLLWSGSALAGDMATLEGKTSKGCAYEATYDPDWVSRKDVEAAFRRQTWDGACVNGKLHGFGTLHDTLRSKDDREVVTHQGLLFVNGKHLWAPHLNTNLEYYKTIRDEHPSQIRHDYIISFSDEEYLGLIRFRFTNNDGSINSIDTYGSDPFSWPTAYFASRFTFKGSRYKNAKLIIDTSRCGGRSACLELDGERVACQTDCGDEWDDIAASGFAVLGRYLDQEMPKLETAAQTAGIDIGGVKTMLAPFVARAEVLSARRIALEKAAVEAQLKSAAEKAAAAEAQRKSSLQAANQAGKLVQSPALDTLLKQALGTKP